MPRTRGVLTASGGALLWGVSGTVAQQLFQQEMLRAAWLVTLGLLVSGVLFLLLTVRKEDSTVWTVWLERR